MSAKKAARVRGLAPTDTGSGVYPHGEHVNLDPDDEHVKMLLEAGQIEWVNDPDDSDDDKQYSKPRAGKAGDA